MLTGKWKLLKELRLISGTVLFLLIAVPWHVLVAMRNPEFLHFYFIHEHFERYLTKEHGRYQPDWFFATVLIAGLFPWISFAGQSLSTGLKGFWEARRQDGVQLFLLVWIVFIFIFFSLSDSKLIPYILPIFPPIAALIGRYLAAYWQDKPEKSFNAGFTVLMLLLLAVAAAAPLLPVIFDLQSKVMEAVKQGQDDILAMSVAAMIAIVILLVTYIQGQKKHLIMVMVFVAVVLMLAGDKIAGHYNKDSMKNIAEVIKSLDKPGDEVVLFHEYYQDLPVYLQRRVTLIEWEKTELDFGATHENVSAWMINDKEFRKRWMKGDHLMFAVMREDAYNWVINDKDFKTLHLYTVLQDGRNILLMNQPPTPEAKKK
jgi:4-amino-4-deoxy-L-arabinose transferase-like glycosyltransferase